MPAEEKRRRIVVARGFAWRPYQERLDFEVVLREIHSWLPRLLTSAVGVESDWVGAG